MEDLIYIIIGLLWLVFTFYTSTKKRKQKQQERSSPSHETQASPEQKIMDELFGKKEIFKDETDPLRPYSGNELVYDNSEIVRDDFSGSETFEDEYEDRGIKSVETNGESYYSDAEKNSFQELVKRAQSHRIDEVDTVNLHIEHPDDKIIKKDFNLRKAMIYQAILESPYG